MEATPKRLPLLFAALTLLPFQPSAVAQVAAAPAGSSSSSSLPDAPEPQIRPDKPAQDSPLTRTALREPPKDITLTGMPKRLLRDQEVIWTSPARLQPRDAIWLVPFATATGLLIGSDHHSMAHSLNLNADSRDKADKVSQAALVGVGLLPASGYVWSLVNHAPQAHETGLLAGEALVNSLAVNEALKVVFRRDRPLDNNAQGKFFSSAWNDGSFPSNHATMAWSMASVFASEYPGWLTTTAAYSLASAVSVSRVLAEQHFPSDVLVGSVSGWLIGRYVYKAHHNFQLNPYETPPLPDNYVARTSTPTGAMPTPPPPPQFALPKDPIAHRPPRLFDGDPDTIGSTNVPMDSWIYPALERLAALGLIPTQNAAIRPWTRQECKRQLRQAQDIADRVSREHPGLIAEAQRLITDLDRELSAESTSSQELALESTYARFGTIAGPALNDSFHFGQTWWNDFGRPQGRGSNAISGFSVRAHYGRMFFYAREEYQHGPGNPAQDDATWNLFNKLDRNEPDVDPFLPRIPQRAAYNRQRPLEMYAGVAFAGNALTFGKQELYWGPTTMGPLSFSSNAEPTYNGRFVSTRPHPIPFMGSWGTYRFDFVMGKLSGHYAPARPWFNGQKIAFNFGDNLEMSFTRWSVLWGVGHPITLSSLKKNILSFNSTGTFRYGDRTDPGDRKGNFDFRFKPPFLGKYVTLYADAYSDDDPNPIGAPRRAFWNPGIYFARLPWLSHMDLRVEAASSQGLVIDFGGHHFYLNDLYLDSNTNKGFILGNAVGRDGRAIEARTSYWVSSRTRIEGGYRQNKGGSQFLPGGSTITDGFVNGSIALNRHWTANIFVQHERFLIPSYMPGAQHNNSGWLQLTWNPEAVLKH